MTNRGISTICIHNMGNITQAARAAALLAGLVLSVFPAFAVAPPVVETFEANPPIVMPGGSVALTISAFDPDCATTCTTGCGLYIRHDLTSWSATGGTIVFEDNGVDSSPYTASAVWQAPDTEGTYTISVYLADSGSWMCGGNQSIMPTIDVEVNLNPNQPPNIDTLTADPLRLFPGEQSSVFCSATDPEDGPVTYSWSADSGSVSPATGNSTVFTAGDVGIASVMCTASDDQGASTDGVVLVTVSGAEALGTLTSGLATPMRMDVTSWGDVYIADRAIGGLSVVNLFTGRQVYRLPLPGITSVAVDWNDNLVTATGGTADVRDRLGYRLLALDPGQHLGPVADVAVDHVNQRYGVLYRRTGQLVVFDASGAFLWAFGTTGDADEQLKGPQGLAATPKGRWLIADSGHGLIKTVDAEGAYVGAFGGLGGGVGEFVQLDDVAVSNVGRIFASDAYQDWVQVFDKDGTPLETIGTYGDQLGQLKTAAGVAVAGAWDRLLVASLNSSRLQVYRTSADDLGAVPSPHGLVASKHPGFNPDTRILDFGDLDVGLSSAPAIVSLRNIGDAPLGIGPMTPSGDFTASSDCGAFIDPWDLCTISVSFLPESIGPRDGKLSFVLSEIGNDLTIDLRGNGIAPASATLTPALLTFKDYAVGTTSPPKSLTLTNTGGLPLDVLDLQISSHFIVNSMCPPIVAVASSCAIDVYFAPQSEGEIIGQLTATLSMIGSKTVQLTGLGVPYVPGIEISDTSVNEGPKSPVAVFDLSLSAAASEEVSVEFAALGDSATAFDDFVPTSGVATFAPGETAVTIEIEILDGDVLETRFEYFYVDLSNPVGATLADARGRCTIVDDEVCPGPELMLDGGAENLNGEGLGEWIELAGLWSVVYDNPAPFEGKASFRATGAERAELFYDVDVRAYAEVVNTGEQVFSFTGYFSGLDPLARDWTQIVVEYWDADHRLILDVFDSGLMPASTAWTMIEDKRVAPSGTGWVRVHLVADFFDETSPGILFDGFSLISIRAPVLQLGGASVFEGDVGDTALEFPLTLVCAYDQDVVFDFATSSGAATAWDDFEEMSGRAVLPSGEVLGLVSVIVISDDVDEPHEDVGLTIDLVTPATVVPLVTRATGWIVNDDFCAQSVGYWLDNAKIWPVTSLTIGGVAYDAEALSDALAAAGLDALYELAAQLVATRFNLEIGSDPVIVPTADDADALLTTFPPGSVPTVSAEQKAIALAASLEQYNNAGCGR